ncbi:MAG: hypothetical protein V5A68_08090, partial [Candidatus Thermoplasmatota archaeon]
MRKNKRICFVGKLSRVFIERDYNILKKYFDVNLVEPEVGLTGLLKTFISVGKNVKNSDLVFCW